jgi:hypothetical protein
MTQEDKSDRQKILDSINSPIIKALEGEGITPSYLAKLLKKELKAKQVKVFSNKSGDVIYSEPLEALDIQQKARQDAHKLLDHYPSERHQVEGEITIQVVNFSGQNVKKGDDDKLSADKDE